MNLGRRIPALNNQPELQNFECRPCGIVFTEAAAAQTARTGVIMPTPMPL
jgi:hypothetical protein